MDPQQRLVLDCVHMALEDGGITKKTIEHTDTAVYIGKCNIWLDISRALAFRYIFTDAQNLIRTETQFQ